MVLADLTAGLATTALLVVVLTGRLELWQLYAATAVASLAEAFQVPAFSVVTTLLVPKSQYTRASGMRSLAESVGQIAAPAIAGVVLAITDLRGVFLLDLATFVVAMGLLSLVPVATDPVTPQPGERPRMWLEVRDAWSFVRSRPGLGGLLAIFGAVNLLASSTYFAVLPVLVLARTGNDAESLAVVQVALGVGGVVGGLVLAAWGGPKRRIHGVLGAGAASFLLGDTLFALGRSLPTWVVAALLASALVPFVVGADQAIWQAKTPVALQGRVFGLRGTIRLASMPLGYALAGPLADGVLDPLLEPGGPLASSLGSLVGTGPGAGVAVMFLATAVLGTVASLAGYAVPSIREVEARLPDADGAG